jgi:hypothetical protein
MFPFFSQFPNLTPPPDVSNPETWSMRAKWAPRMVFEASSWEVPFDLFPGLPPRGPFRSQEEPGEDVAQSPSGRWIYARVTLPAAKELYAYSGSKRGTFCFDGDVVFPVVYEIQSPGRSQIWMSMTPMEFLSQRPGIRMAKGHTIVGGLGLGYMLQAVMEKRSVERVTLVERDEELVDWILPRLRQHLPDKELEVVVGDAYKEVPKMTADVALIDVFPSYGNNDFWMNDLRRDTPRANIPTMWGWGTAAINSGY